MNPKNPYYILELSHKATPGEIERQGRKLLGLFEVGATKASTYTCPLGSFPRDPTMVREAMAALRDPERRMRDGALVALLDVHPSASSTKEEEEEGKEKEEGDRLHLGLDAPLPDAFLAGGYRGL